VIVEHGVPAIRTAHKWREDGAPPSKPSASRPSMTVELKWLIIPGSGTDARRI
jgi:hypothetical protein